MAATSTQRPWLDQHFPNHYPYSQNQLGKNGNVYEIYDSHNFRAPIMSPVAVPKRKPVPIRTHWENRSPDIVTHIDNTLPVLSNNTTSPRNGGPTESLAHVGADLNSTSSNSPVSPSTVVKRKQISAVSKQISISDINNAVDYHDYDGFATPAAKIVTTLNSRMGPFMEPSTYIEDSYFGVSDIDHRAGDGTRRFPQPNSPSAMMYESPKRVPVPNRGESTKACQLRRGGTPRSKRHSLTIDTGASNKMKWGEKIRSSKSRSLSDGAIQTSQVDVARLDVTGSQLLNAKLDRTKEWALDLPSTEVPENEHAKTLTGPEERESRVSIDFSDSDVSEWQVGDVESNGESAPNSPRLDPKSKTMQKQRQPSHKYPSRYHRSASNDFPKSPSQMSPKSIYAPRGGTHSRSSSSPILSRPIPACTFRNSSFQLPDRSLVNSPIDEESENVFFSPDGTSIVYQVPKQNFPPSAETRVWPGPRRVKIPPSNLGNPNVTSSSLSSSASDSSWSTKSSLTSNSSNETRHREHQRTKSASDIKDIEYEDPGTPTFDEISPSETKIRPTEPRRTVSADVISWDKWSDSPFYQSQLSSHRLRSNNFDLQKAMLAAQRKSLLTRPDQFTSETAQGFSHVLAKPQTQWGNSTENEKGNKTSGSKRDSVEMMRSGGTHSATGWGSGFEQLHREAMRKMQAKANMHL